MSEAFTSDHPAVQKTARHVNPAFIKLLGVLGYGRVFTRAEGLWVWDHQDRRYLDMLAGFGSFNVGHNHPRLVARLKAFLDELPFNVVHVGPSVQEADLAAKLSELAPDPLEVSLFANSGAEAVEAGLKLARAATGRKGFVSCEGGFHGTNLGTLSIMGEKRFRKPFEPLLEGCTRVPFGDLDALSAALKAKPAAFVVEPILGEGGVVIPPEGYLQEAAVLCRKRGTLLVLDEVQTGIGRTGTLFACEQEGVVPDVLVLAKALGGGLLPISVAMTSAHWMNKAYGSTDRFDLHGSTFGGNGLACAAAMETLDIVADEGLVENARLRGEQLALGLRERLAGHPFVKDVRGRGLLVAIELGPTDAGLANKLAAPLVGLLSKQVFGQWAAVKLLEAGIICQPAVQQWDVLRLEPPLTVGAAEVQLTIDAVGEILDAYRGVTALLKDVSARIGKQALAGWSF